VGKEDETLKEFAFRATIFWPIIVIKEISELEKDYYFPFQYETAKYDDKELREKEIEKIKKIFSLQELP
jgi:hypothetical protein